MDIPSYFLRTIVDYYKKRIAKFAIPEEGIVRRLRRVAREEASVVPSH